MGYKLEKNLIFSVLLLAAVASIPMAYAEIEFSSVIEASGDDALDNPTDVALEGRLGNKIHVVDSANNRINIFNANGNHDDAYGLQGTGNGQFEKPLAIAYYADDFFVVDSDNSRVQIFNNDGEYQLTFGSSRGNDDLRKAEGIAIHKNTNDIFVSSTENDSVSVFNIDGRFQYKFNTYDGTNFNNPKNMIIDSNTLYVADSGNNKIAVFEISSDCPSGTVESVDGICFVKTFGSSGDGDGEFDAPAGLAFDDDEDLLYVADSGNNRIQVFEILDTQTCSSSTQIVDKVCFVEEFGARGTGDGKFNTPLGIALDTRNNLLYVADSGNDRIQKLTLEAESSTTTNVPDKPVRLKATAVSPTSIILTWQEPEQDESTPEITGYKIEYKAGSGGYETVIENSRSKATSFIHQGLDESQRYSYQVYSINSAGESDFVTKSGQPAHTDVPAALTATAISPDEIRLTWLPPSNTYGQSVGGYEIHREFERGVYGSIGETDNDVTTFVVSDLTTDKTYTYAVTAKFGISMTDKSATASATPREDSDAVSSDPITSTITPVTVPSPPIKLTTTVESETSVSLAWSAPADDGNSEITGYKIESKKDNDSFSTIKTNTQSPTRTYTDTELTTDSKYTYRVSAINEKGTSEPSNQSTATPKSPGLEISPIGKLAIDEEKLLAFTVRLADNSIKDATFSLINSPPTGAKITNTGMFTWTPTDSDGGETYTFGVDAKKDGMSDTQTLTITVNDSIDESASEIQPEPDPEPKPEPTPEPPPEEPLAIPAPFVDEAEDPQTYVDRYNTESKYKEWFDGTYPEYESIYEAVGLEAPKEPADFVDPNLDPQYYVDRYNNEQTYKDWFDNTYPDMTIYEAVGLEAPKEPADFVDPNLDPQYYVDRYNNEQTYKDWFDNTYPDMTIYEAVGLEEPVEGAETENSDPESEKKFGYCGPGTTLIDGVCTIVAQQQQQKSWWQLW